MNFKKILCVLGCFLLCVPFAACDVISPQTPNDGETPSTQTPSTQDPSGDKPSTQKPSDGDTTGGDIKDDNDVEVKEPDTTDHDFTLTEQGNGSYTYKCNDCDEENTVVITYTSGTENAYTVEGNTITFSNVTANSAYEISGKFCGNIVIDATEDYKFELQMSGFTLSSHTACPVTILSGDKVTLSAKKSTENYIYDMRAAVDETDETAISASVYALCDLNIQGKGSLNVKSVNNNGIHTKDDLAVKNLSLQVDCIDNALKGNDSVAIESGEIVLIARQGDGIKTSNSDVSSKGNQRGTVAITGGDILIYAACDGIDAAYDVVIDESAASVNLQIFTDKYSKYSEEVTAVANSVYYVRYSSTTYKYSLKFYNDESDAVWYNSSSYTTSSSSGRPGSSSYYYYSITKPSGYAYVKLFVYSSSQQQGQGESYAYCSGNMAVNNNYDTIALTKSGSNFSCSWTNKTTTSQWGGGMGGGMNDGNSDKGDYSTKGLKADNEIVISGGTVVISAYDDAIHANSDVVLENGNSPLGNVTISGGSLTLRSNDDGIHADNKTLISGGTVNVVGSYEGIEGTLVEIAGGNVSVVSSDDGINGTATTGTGIAVSGGTLYVYAGGDGVDSNSRTSYGGMVFSGGKSVIISKGSSDTSIDNENGYQYTGGCVIGISVSNNFNSEATKCSNFSSVGTSKTLSLTSGNYLVVTDFATVKMPVSINNAFVVCLGKTGASVASSSSTSYELDANGVYWNEN